VGYRCVSLRFLSDWASRAAARSPPAPAGPNTSCAPADRWRNVRESAPSAALPAPECWSPSWSSVGVWLTGPHRSGGVCGIGINLQWAPERAARLEQPRDEVVDRLRHKIEQWTDVPDEVVLARWRQLSDTLGRRVRVEFSGQTIEGVAQDIGPRGELIVDGKPVVAGSLTLL